MALLLAGGGRVEPLTELASAAAGLAVGEHTELVTDPTGAALSDYFEEPVASGTSTITWSNKLGWSSLDNEVRFFATPANINTPWEFLVYSDATNQWTNGPVIDGLGFGHGYDHNCCNAADGISYFRQYNSTQLQQYTKAADAWSALPLPGGSASVQVASAIEHFPELGGVVFVDCVKGIWLYEEATDSWQEIDTSPMEATEYHNFAVYSPIHQQVLFGGGNGSAKVWVIDSTGTVTQKTNAPTNLNISSASPSFNGALITVDPKGGDFLIKQKQANTWWSYDPVGDSYTSFNPSIPFSTTYDVVATPIVDHGVILFANYNTSASSVYLYRHS